jgi:enamine deaminase RidA (YjgF/YER057c/UK114 family)
MKGLPFSEAVQVGTLLYLAGQVGLGEDGKLVHGAGMERYQAA